MSHRSCPRVPARRRWATISATSTACCLPSPATATALPSSERYATDLKRELSLVPGVARVALWGVQDRRIYLDASLSQLTQLGISEASLERAVAQQNAVAAAGSVALGPPARSGHPVRSVSRSRIRRRPPRPGLAGRELSSDRQRAAAGRPHPDRRLRRPASLGYRDPPLTMMRYDGQPAIALAITNQPGVNVVELGKRVDARLGRADRRTCRSASRSIACTGSRS